MARKGNQQKNGLGRTTVLPEKKDKTRLQAMNGDSMDPSISHKFEEKSPSNGFKGAARNESPMSNSEKGTDDHVNSGNGVGQHGLSYVLGSLSSASVLSVIKVATQWLKKQKPRVDTLVTLSVQAYDYVCIRSEYLRPIMWRWIAHSGRLVLLLSMLWLDCSLRGLDSLLRLGTTSFLAVIWCSILSVMAMVGISKFFIMLVLVGSLAIFVSFSFSLLMTAIFAIVVLCIYGSFWTTGLVVLCAGIAFGLRHERIALSIVTVYSMFCARAYMGWLGLLLGLNLSFFSSDLLIYFLKNNMSEHGPSNQQEPFRERRGGSGGRFYVDPDDAFQAAGEGLDRGPGMPSCSGTETELTSEDEVARLLNCTDHYSALGLSRYGEIDAVSLKREYRKKAMLVHPDKNMGNEKAAEAFKKLQNAYEILLDSTKRKSYDDELRREELLNYFRRLQNSSQNNGRHGLFAEVNARTVVDSVDSHGLSRRIACKKCNMFHDWILTERLKSRSRWCQDCKDFHLAKDGDGWVEQSSHPLLFGLLQKADTPSAYVCAESQIYDVTGWFLCQGMTCPANTHKPSFHVNTNITSKQPHANGYNTSHKGRPNPSSMDESMTEEDFFEWLHNAVQSGIFEPKHSPPENPLAKTSSSKGSGGKKRRKGKKQS